jgi:N-acetylglucosaminyldiphosphoundecaprenol N-acetyl-beta-D-mannosaminyltransferase
LSPIALEDVHGEQDINDWRGRPCWARPSEVPEYTETNLSVVSRPVLGTRVDATSYEDASLRVVRWAHEGRSAYVCVAATHLIMEAHDSAALRRDVNGAHLVTPDGRPLVWGLKALGVRDASQVRGTDLMTHVVERAAHENVPIGLYGGTPESLESLVRVLETRFPEVRVVCRISPPFRPLTPEEDEAETQKIVGSGARILFVGIGCPKQERWMVTHKERIPAVMVGVGAAFDFHAGRVRQAPRWMQWAGLEWVFRLIMNPRRLWRRYAKHNPRFVGLFLLQLLGLRRFDGDVGPGEPESLAGEPPAGPQHASTSASGRP